jgi:hypothetical protein
MGWGRLVVRVGRTDGWDIKGGGDKNPKPIRKEKK